MERVMTMPWHQSIEELSEINLAKRAIKGDSNAFTELMKRHKAYFYRMAYSYVKNEQQALDIVQETTYQGLLKIHQLTQAHYFKTWMTKILIHIAIKEIGNYQSLTSIEACSEIKETTKVLAIEDKLDLYDAIDTLRPEYRTVIILKYFNDYTIDEIASLMDLSSNTVKSHLKRARVELSQLLKGGSLNE